MVVADALSRAHLLNCKPEIDKSDMTHHMHSIISQLPARLAQFQQETAKDPDLQKLKSYTINSWLSKHDILPALLPFYNLRDEIVYNYDLLLKGQQISHRTSIIESRSQINYSSRTSWYRAL